MKVLNDLKFNRKKAIESSHFLKKGKYVLLPNLRTYVHKDKYNETICRFPKDRTKATKAIFHKLLRPWFSFKVKKSGDFGGEAMYFSTISNFNHRDCKIFSYEQGKMVVLSANKKRYDLYLKNREKVSGLFPLPKLYEINSEKMFVVEEFILNKQCEKSGSSELLDCLFEFYFKYYEECKKTNRFKKTSENREHICQEITENECPVLYLHHADLSIDNVIYCREPKESLVFIDLDHENYYPPFYDVFFMIINQAFADSNLKMLELFNKGRYDKYLCKYAEENGVAVKDVVKSCLKSLWYKRLNTYSHEKKEQMKNAFIVLMTELEGRVADGKSY